MEETVFSVLAADGQWHDYTRFVLSGGYEWSDDDVDSEKSVRTKNKARMRRDKLAEKINTSYTMRDMDRAELRQLRRDLKHAPTFQARILDPEGVIQREFYSTSVKATLILTEEGHDIWGEPTFNLHEV